MTRALPFLLSALCLLASAFAQGQDDEAVRVFIFAGLSNMVGADSKVADIERFPPFSGLGAPQEQVRFWHSTFSLHTQGHLHDIDVIEHELPPVVPIHVLIVTVVVDAIVGIWVVVADWRWFFRRCGW